MQSDVGDHADQCGPDSQKSRGLPLPTMQELASVYSHAPVLSPGVAVSNRISRRVARDLTLYGCAGSV